MGLAGRPVFQAALVTAQPLLDHQQGLVGAGIGVRGIGIGLERDAGIEVQRAVGSKTEAVLAERDVAGIVAVKIFAQYLLGALAYSSAQCVADTDAFSRNSERHIEGLDC